MKNYMKILILFVFAFILICCDKEPEKTIPEDNTKQLVNLMKSYSHLYWRDSTTDICYSVPYLKNWDSVDLRDAVGFPCTDKVLQKIKEQDQ